MKDHLSPWKLLPAAPGKCPECATEHEPEIPHNWSSLFYQYHFFRNKGRFPTRKDAMRHCTPSMRKRWTKALKERGIKV